MVEIGSEFWTSDLTHRRSSLFQANCAFFLSGRTALDFVIKDILGTFKVQSVYMPSYCCHTMIYPFVRNGITPTFYDVVFDARQSFRVLLKESATCDIVVLMQYYGYSRDQDPTIDSLTQQCISRGQIVVEDITHSLFSGRAETSTANYVYGSIRKWTGIASGGYAWKNKGCFSIALPSKTNERYINLRRQAASEKSRYVVDGGEKNFLKLFSDAEAILEKDYIDYLADARSVHEILYLDTYLMTKRRRQNADILINEMQDRKDISLLFPTMSKTDTPLFVPIYCHGDFRDELKKHLMGHSIYCPVHWPVSSFHQISSTAYMMYRNVFSLICDQRYGEREMYRLCNVLRKFRS